MNKILLTEALEMLIRDSSNGMRLQKNGSPLSKGSIVNYKAVLRNLQNFEAKKQKQYVLTANTESRSRHHKSQVMYWQRFYRNFRQFLFSECNAHDNYVALQMRIIKLVFKYMRNDKFFPVGRYEYIFYGPRVNNSIHVFPIELLGKVIAEHESYDLTKRQHEILAIFLFGICVGLRYSDLKALKAINILRVEDGHYLQTISRKTKTGTRVKLPIYAVEIVRKYGKKKGSLFELPELQNFGVNLKNIAERLNWTWPVQVYQSKYGKLKMEKNIRFCDVISSHMMRRTSITALLTQGINESAVRQISGHAQGSKEFYRYVQYSQTYMDQQTDHAWQNILDLREVKTST